MYPSILNANPRHINPYGYTPTKAVCIIMIVLFATSTALHTGQAIYTRRWYLLCTAVLCGLSECIGWSARLWSSYGVYNLTPFLMQISTTILAPTFLAAANFIILGTVIGLLGPQFSRMPARRYAVVFVSFDAFCLVIQAIGGGMASKEASSKTGNAKKGAHVMLVGIVLQLIEMAIYVALATEFFINYSHRKPVRTIKDAEHSSAAAHHSTDPEARDHNDAEHKVSEELPAVDVETNHTLGQRTMDGRMKLMIFGMGFSTLCLFIRAVYRTAELSDGWKGKIIHTQVLFNVLDGAMSVIAMFTLNFLHPGHLLN